MRGRSARWTTWGQILDRGPEGGAEAAADAQRANPNTPTEPTMGWGLEGGAEAAAEAQRSNPTTPTEPTLDWGPPSIGAEAADDTGE